MTYMHINYDTFYLKLYLEDVYFKIQIVPLLLYVTYITFLLFYI